MHYRPSSAGRKRVRRLRWSIKRAKEKIHDEYLSFALNTQTLVYSITQAGNKLAQHVRNTFAGLRSIDFQFDMLVPCQIKIHPNRLALICQGCEGCWLLLLTRPAGRESHFSFTHMHLLLKYLIKYGLD